MHNSYNGSAGYTQGNVINYASNKKNINLIISHEVNHALFWSKLRFSQDLINWIPYMNEVGNWWNIGQDLSCNLLYLPTVIDDNNYYNQPSEIDAYFMERK